MAAKKTITKKNIDVDGELKNKKQQCDICGKQLAYSNFYKSKSSLCKGNHGIMRYCKKCIMEQFDEFLEETNNNGILAIKFTCAKFSIPFVESFANGSVREATNINEKKKNENILNGDINEETMKSPFGCYMKTLNSLGMKNGFTDTDFNYKFNMSLTEDENVSVDIFNDKARNLKVTNEMIEFWDGVKDKKKLYILEKIWNEYANSYKISNPVHVKLFKECSFLELQSIEKRNANINADVSEITKKITDLLNSLKLLPKNKKDEGDNIDTSDGIAIKASEHTHPIPDTQWKDKENFMKCIGYMWRGHTMMNMGVQDNNPEYAKIMKDLAIETDSPKKDGDK